MKKIMTWTLLAGWLSASTVSSGAFAGGQASATGTAVAEITNERLAISNDTSLNFGTILKGDGGGHVIVTPDDERMVHGNVIVSDTDPFGSASFQVRGMPNEAYSILLPRKFELLSSANGGEGDDDTTLKVRQITSKSENAGSFTHQKRVHTVLDASGRDSLRVGGKLIVPGNAAAGDYNGELPVTVSY